MPPGSKLLLNTVVRVLLYAKMRKETEETIIFFVTFLSLVAFQLGGRVVGPLATPGYAYDVTIVFGLYHL